MPELPEVETTKNGLIPHLLNQVVGSTSINIEKLRWEIPKHIPKTIFGMVLRDITRRGKYLLFVFDSGTLIIHLGMSGSISISPSSTKVVKHDHFEIYFENDIVMRLNDPRRFGSVLFSYDGKHPLLDHLGPEPLESDFTINFLFEHSRNKRQNIKAYIMDSKIVVGVGNIYACESLFVSRINPLTPARDVSKSQYKMLTGNIKSILIKSIESGGTTLNDYSNVDGSPGYFSQTLMVYGRENLPCVDCSSLIQRQTQNQRSTFYCPTCQS